MPTEDRRAAESPRVAAVLDRFQVVLNKGAKDGIRLGESFLIFAMGPEVEDPVTGQNLGPIELVKGRGKVIHLQDTMATLRSSDENPIYSSLPGFGRPQPIRYEEQPFRDIEVGDVARRI
jgi:hypothetical protein